MSNHDGVASLDGIAMIGLAGRFPGASTVEAFWQNLCHGVESIQTFSDEELLAAEVDPQVLAQPNYVKAGAPLDKVEYFDAAFFGFNPREAAVMDPQQRLFLECAWEALERAGYDTATYSGRIGTFAGIGWGSYFLNHIATNPDLLASMTGYQTLLGNEKDFISTRTAYLLNLTGPSITVQTACSTSLVATHLACHSLLSYQCDMALAGGAAIALPQAGYLYESGGILSPDGHCRAFDAQAQGTVAGSGVGLVVLKRLEDALADGDQIYAVIKGSAVNNDGALKVGFTAPSVTGQAEAIAEALAFADINPDTLQYVETHGTGTALGDPIEIAALTQVFRSQTERNQFCAIGSVKTNVGHLDTAAGVTSLIKAALALHHGQIPPSLYFEQPNPQIDFANSPFYVNASLQDWPQTDTPHRAGVSSFGMGGTNAHLVLEAAPEREPSSPSRPWQLLVLSAKTPTALEQVTQNLIAHLQQQPEVNLADVAYTLQVGRRAFEHRRMVVCQTVAAAIAALQTPTQPPVLTHHQPEASRTIAWMFPGQGAQYVNMGRELYDCEPVFQRWIDHCATVLQPHLGLDVRSLLYPHPGDEAAATQHLQQTAIAQPALFTVEYALAQLWMQWGVEPDVLIGHSIGEYVAACLAGVFTLEDALMLVAQRGRLMQSMPSGAMLAVSLAAAEVTPWLSSDVALAAVNAPQMSVLAGTEAAIQELQSKLEQQGIGCQRLHTSHAFHSPMMEPMVQPFQQLVAQVQRQAPQKRWISNVTGTWITTAEATDPAYWAQHLRQPARFAEGLANILEDANGVLLEVGPGRTLSTLARQCPGVGGVILSSLRHPRDTQSDVAFLLNTIGRLWLAGVTLDWSRFYSHEQRHRLCLPTYPFERQRYWIERRADKATNPPALSAAPSEKAPLDQWFYIPTWKQKPLVAGSADVQPQTWLVFCDDRTPPSLQLAQPLQQQEHTVIQVQVGSAFSRIGEQTYTVQPQRAEDYKSLLRELQAQQLIPNQLVHAWSLTVTPDSTVDEILARGFYSLLFLAQAIAEFHQSSPLHLQVLTKGLYSVTGTETLIPEQATLLGPCQLIPQEYPHITCRVIDLTWPASSESLIQDLLQPSPEPAIAHRGRHRWVRNYESVTLPAVNSLPQVLRSQGVYVITGGLGGIGLTLANYLAEAVQARLILLSRSGLPKRCDWNREDLPAKVQATIHTVQSLEAKGAQVQVIAADVTEADSVQTAIAQAIEQFGTIHGVIHAAGVPGGGLMQLKTPEAAAQVLAPKLQGTRCLQQALQGIELDFFMLCSSLTAIVSELGQVDYCAANAFLDAWAQAQVGQLRAIAINWDTWQSVGMAAQTTIPDALKHQRQNNLELGMSPDEGVEVFQRALQNQLPQVIVSTQDLEQALAASREQAQQALAATQMASTVQQPRSLTTPYVAPRNATEQQIADIWQDLLGVHPVGIHDNFFELGGHSLLAVQTVSRLRDAFQVELPLKVLLAEAPTVAELAGAIAQLQLQHPDLGEKATADIPRRPADATIPLSVEQQRLYFFEQLVPDRALYNMPVAIRLTGALNLAVLEQSWQAIAQRHEILRTRFVSQAGQTVQVVQPAVDLTVTVVDLQDLAGAAQADAVQRHLIQLAQQPFDISQAPLLRLTLLRLNPTEQVLVCVLHHLIADGWSRGLLIQELGTLYSAGVTGQAISLPELPIQYGDFALWQQQQSQSPELTRHLEYWQHQLAAPLPVLELPSDSPRPLTQSFRGAKQTVQLPLPLTTALKTLSQQEGATLFMTLLAGFKALLAAYTGQTDIIVGTDIANRHRPDIERLIGFFVNQLVLRTDVSPELSFRQLIQRVRDMTLAAYSHQEVPFEQLVATLNPDRDPSRAPLFQAKLVLQNVPTPDWQLPGLTVEVLPDIDTSSTALDLFLSLTEAPDGLSGSLEYNTDLFTAATIQRFWAHFQQLLTDAVTNPDQVLGRHCLLTTEEKAQRQIWNQTGVDYPLDRCLHHWIDDQVERTPDAIAVVFGETQLTYRELNQRANQLAHHLQQLGVKPDTLVGICVERSLEMVIGLLGILKAGGAYVPLDPSYPPERLAFMLQDAQVPILLTQSALLNTLPPTTAQTLCLDSPLRHYPSTHPPIHSLTSSSLAYVIYTSGSTGKPKGAMNTHQGICNRLLWMQDAYGLTAGDRVLQKTPFSFDVSVWEFFWPLMTGACLVVAPPDAHKDSAELVRLITQHQITTLHFVPSMLRVFLHEPGVTACSSLRRVICSGEALAVDLPQLFFQRLTAELHNLYGPTEAAVDVTAWGCQRDWRDRTIPIGYPIANTQLHILNSYLQPVPVGVAGELHIGGVGVGRGYLNRPELTAEKFISNPFSNDGDRLYKTGDLARYRPDGSIEYLGRLDHQVKLRGLRIELGEIEAVLTQYSAVQEAVVVARGDQSGQVQLVAYWVARQGAEVDVDQVRSHLLQSLPDYMVPAQFIRLEALPTLPNGKLDRRALPAPIWEANAKTFAAPSNSTEQRLCEIWSKYLQCDRIGIHDSFFELGGHSLLATQVISEIRQVFEIELPLRCLFEAPTVAGLAVQVNQAITTASTPDVPALQPVSRDQPLPLSFAQQRLWFLQQLEPDAPLFNGAALVCLQGTLHVPALEQSLQEIVQRHETLRTRFVMVEGELVQQILPELPVSLPVVDLSDMAEPVQSQQVQTLAQEVAQHSFNLTTGPLLRVSLLCLSPTDHCLLINLHHIVSDGWSIGVLVRELAALYPAFVQGQPSPLPALPIQYADYALWQRQWLQGEVLQTQLDYWKQQLDKQPPTLVFPSEKTTGAHTEPHTGKQHKFTLSTELTTALKQLSQQQNVTLFMTLLAAFDVLLFDLTGTTDLLVGSPIANRHRPEIEDLIGFFVNTLILRTDVAGDPSFTELLQRVRQVALGAYAHQDLPFDQLVSELQPNRTVSQAPFFRVWFVLQNTPMPPLELPDLKLDVTDLATGLVRHDLKLDLTETGSQLSGFFEYKTAVFDEAAIAHLHARLEQLLQQITADPDQRLSQIRQHLQQVDQQQTQAQATAFQANQRQRLSRLSRRPSLHNPA